MIITKFLLIEFIPDLHLWDNCKHIEYNCFDAKGHEQNADKHNT